MSHNPTIYRAQQIMNKWILGWHPSKIEAIRYHRYGPKISNPNTQIPNNIQIRKSNDPNILPTYLLFDGHFACFEF
jgi:hypothetical protein